MLAPVDTTHDVELVAGCGRMLKTAWGWEVTTITPSTALRPASADAARTGSPKAHATTRRAASPPSSRSLPTSRPRASSPSSVSPASLRSLGAPTELVARARRSRDDETRHAVRDAMRRIADDETTHASLSWDVAAWLEPCLTEAERQQLEIVRSGALRDLSGALQREPHHDLRTAADLPGAREAQQLLASLVTTRTPLPAAGPRRSLPH